MAAASSVGPSSGLLKARLAKSLAGSKAKGVDGVKMKVGSAAPGSPVSPATATTFGSLGLDNELNVALQAQGKGLLNALSHTTLSVFTFMLLLSHFAAGITVPTPVQKSVIPRILSGENLVMAASTGSGKTLAYLLPCLQSMAAEEAEGYMRRPKRPRCLVLVPTRELAAQVLDCVKQVGHYSRVSASAVLGGEPYTLQKMQVCPHITYVCGGSTAYT
jgi:superfamily II DNA/RNA helicase